MQYQSIKKSKNVIKNFRPISLLRIFSKSFERLILNSLFNYLMQNKLLKKCRSGFIPVDLCVAQLSCVVQIYALRRQVHMKSIKVLIVTHQLTREGFFFIFRKPLIRSGMRV